MRVGLIASTAGHLVVLLWGVVSFPDAKPFDIPPVDSLPVDLVPISELTRLRIGEKTAEVREIEATKPSEKPVKEPEPQEKPAEKTAAKPRQATPEPTPPPAPTPDPTPAPPEPPTPTPPAPTPPAPEPPAPEQPAPRAEPEPAPAPEPEKKVAEAPPPPPSVRPRSKPTPPPRQEPKRDDFNPNQIAALLNKVDPAGGATSQTDTPASLGSRLGQSGVTMSQSELDALRGQISRCWNPPAGAAGAGDLNVRLKVFLTPAGEVDQRPEVMNSSANPTFGIAAESARRAVLRCAPYSLPAEKYDAWREVIINFDPRELLGG
ncbi:cell envelope biogenesis protein TolA [Stappia sp.]|uniref:cell envelope biogenesis protein TolA n=1 Tax=Stappia sp. TaxID=1870903 RepID=UPI003D13F7D9